LLLLIRGVRWTGRQAARSPSGSAVRRVAVAVGRTMAIDGQHVVSICPLQLPVVYIYVYIYAW
jgi:hypothetical protein